MPVDRQRMRPWLEEQIDSGRIKGLIWVNKEEKIFQIPWIHAARHGWDLDKDAPLFMNWAIHTGKYNPGLDKPDPKTWKANFRCAMNSLPDIEEVKDLSMKSGRNAFRMYRILSPPERAARKAKKKKVEREAKTNPPAQRRKAKASEPQAAEVPLPDSTVLLTEQVQQSDAGSPSKTLLSDLQVCSVVEVTTENEESAVSSTQVPSGLQISPVSSCGADSDTGSVCSEDGVMPQDLSVSAREAGASVLRTAPCLDDKAGSFLSSEMTNFWVTSCREESPMISYSVEPWRPFLSSLAFELGAGSGSAPRASVIMKAVDLSSRKT